MVRGITHILTNNVNFQNEAGQNKDGTKYKAFPVVCGQNEQPPYSVVRQVSYLPRQCASGRARQYDSSFIVASYHKNFEDVEELNEAVVDALDHIGGTYNGVSFTLITHEDSSDEDYDVDRGCFVKVSRFNAVVNANTTT